MKNKLCIILAVAICTTLHTNESNYNGDLKATPTALFCFFNTPNIKTTLFSGGNELIKSLSEQKNSPLGRFLGTDLGNYDQVAALTRAASQAIVKDMMDAMKPYLWCALGIGVGIYFLCNYLDPYWKVYKIRKKQERLKQLNNKDPNTRKSNKCFIL